VRLIHGKGKGVRRAEVRRMLADDARVVETFDAPPEITYEDEITKTAEIQHPVFGKNFVNKNDTELIKIIEQLKIRDIDVSMDNDTLFGFDFSIIIFYLGFLFAKEHISCHPISTRSVTISLTDEAKKKLKI
jgi:hypothetical protein